MPRAARLRQCRPRRWLAMLAEKADDPARRSYDLTLSFTGV